MFKEFPAMVTVNRRRIMRLPGIRMLVISYPDFPWSRWFDLATFETPGQRIGLTARGWRYANPRALRRGARSS